MWEPNPISDKYDLRDVGVQAWICQSECATCSCTRVVADVLASRSIGVKQVLAWGVSSELKHDIQQAKARVGEKIEERGDFLSIETYNPVPDSFWAVSDDEL